uniref:Uncharacterized protein n=1 Tax=Anguilla anguilla TaxID=7936 RepID=A0A0E9PQP2_ANGAN
MRWFLVISHFQRKRWEGTLWSEDNSR